MGLLLRWVGLACLWFPPFVTEKLVHPTCHFVSLLRRLISHAGAGRCHRKMQSCRSQKLCLDLYWITLGNAKWESRLKH